MNKAEIPRGPFLKLKIKSQTAQKSQQKRVDQVNFLSKERASALETSVVMGPHADELAGETLGVGSPKGEGCLSAGGENLSSQKSGFRNSNLPTSDDETIKECLI